MRRANLAMPLEGKNEKKLETKVSQADQARIYTVCFSFTIVIWGYKAMGIFVLLYLPCLCAKSEAWFGKNIIIGVHSLLAIRVLENSFGILINYS